jgi:hypothetical protein
MWVPPGQPEIDAEFRGAVLLLAEWAGPQWHINEKSNFFLIRDLLISLVISLSEFDWQMERTRFSIRQKSVRNWPRLQDAVDNFISASDNELNVSAKRIALLKFLNLLPKSKQINITVEDGWKALLEALNTGRKFLDCDQNAPFHFGPIEYTSLPKRLPSHLTVAGVAMADLVSTHRVATSGKRLLSYPRKPTLSDDLPWKSFLLFLQAVFPDDFIDESSLQKKTMNLQRQDVVLHLMR